MKKLSLLLGAMSGAMAGYLFSNKKLRDDIMMAKDPEAAAKMLGKHLQHDGKQFASQVQDFVKSDEVQKKLHQAQKYAKKKTDQATKELKKLMKMGTKSAKSGIKTATRSAKRAAKRVKSKTRLLS